MENEVQIKSVFLNLRQGIKGFLEFFTGFFKFVFKRFYITLPLLILTLVGGYYIDKLIVADKTARIIISQNFDSVNYLYESIHTIQDLTETRDEETLEKIGLVGLSDIQINPIIDVNILFKNSVDTRNLEALLNEVPIDKDTKNGSTLNSQAFNSSYKKHEIIIQVKNGVNDKIIDNLNELINNNAYYSSVKNQLLINLSNQIKDNKIIVNQIDSLIKKSYSKSITNAEVIAAQLSDSDLNSLLNTKKTLIDIIRDNELDIIMSQQTFMVLNKPVFSTNKIKLRDKNILLFPFLSLVLLFLIYSFRKLYPKH